jgi:RNA polymerase sigma factor (sigma-70 family)
MFNEKQVVEDILKGNTTAFGQLVRQYERLVFLVAGRFVTNASDKEDIAQEVFIKVYKGLPRFQHDSKLSTWIAQITYFTAINYFKKHKRLPIDDLPENIDQSIFTDDDPQTLASKRDMIRYVELLVEQLPSMYRMVISLFHQHEFSCEEISQMTGMPEGTVKSYLFRGRKLLKEKLSIVLKEERYE